MAEVVWTEPALEDVRRIIEYIALDSPVYAERVGRSLAQAPRRLADFLLSGRRVPEFGEPELRELIYGSYRIFYRYLDPVCHIVAVIHAHRNIADMEIG